MKYDNVGGFKWPRSGPCPLGTVHIMPESAMPFSISHVTFFMPVREATEAHFVAQELSWTHMI